MRPRTMVGPDAAAASRGDVLVIFGLRRPGEGDDLAHRADAPMPESISLDLEFSEAGGEGATPYELLLHAAMIGQDLRFTRQDSVEEAWRVMQPLIDDPPAPHTYRPGSWGPKAADALVSEHGGWYGPWVA